MGETEASYFSAVHLCRFILVLILSLVLKVSASAIGQEDTFTKEIHDTSQREAHAPI